MSRAAAAAAVKTMSREHLKRVISGEAKEFLPAVIIDVREPEEVAMGMIPSAVSLPLQTVPGILSLDPENLAQALQLDGSDDFEPDETHFIFYCRSGARSGAVSGWLCGGIGVGFLCVRVSCCSALHGVHFDYVAAKAATCGLLDTQSVGFRCT